MIINEKFKEEHIIISHGKPNGQSTLIKSSMEDHQRW